MATATDDLLDGITSRTTKEELTQRLRKATTRLRKAERQKMTRLAEIEERLKGKVQTAPPETLRQVIVNGTTDEWREVEQFLGEFEGDGDEPNLLPPALQRLTVGARIMLGDVSDGNG